MSQLEFVVDNWFMDPIKNADQIVYLVGAFTVNDSQQVEDKLDLMTERMGVLEDNQHKLLLELMKVQKSLLQI